MSEASPSAGSRSVFRALGDGLSAERSSRLVAVAALLVPLVLFAGSGWFTYRDTEAQAEAQMRRTLDLTFEHAQRVFDSQRLAVSTIEEMIEGLSDEQVRANERRIGERIGRLIETMPQVGNVWILGKDGAPLVATTVFPLPAGLNYGDRAYFAAHRDREADVVISDTLRGRLRDVPFFQYSKRRTHRDGSFAGVIALSIPPKYFTDLYSGLADVGQNYTASLVREDGAVLARFPGVEGSVRLGPATMFMRSIATAPMGGSYHAPSSGVDGVDRMYVYRKLPQLPIYVNFGLARESVRAEWRAKMASQLMIGAPAALALFLLALGAARRAARESEMLRELQEETRRRREAEEGLRQAQKMEAVGQLTAGIAHDFNNLLTGIGGALDIVLRRFPTPEPAMRYMNVARTSVDRAAALTQRLLAFSRQQPLQIEVVEANRLVAAMSELLRRTLGEQIRIETVLAAGLWRARADAAQLESAILNLAINARDAMPDGGVLTIETANVQVDDAYAIANADATAGDYVMIAVSDTGAGMDSSTLARAADPFFTTKQRGHGTGLGLSMIYGYAKQAGGHMKIYSEPGQGTVVKLYLPRVAEDAPSASPADSIAPRKALVDAPIGCTVLVVEDDLAVRDFAVSALRHLGCTVLEAGDGAAALALLEAHPEVHLLFTDIGLPGPMNGRQIADRAVERRPDLRVLFMTGYTANAIVHNGMLDPGVDFIGKPFSMDALERKVRSMGFGPQTPS
jgi:signal transduction histidine kinase